MKVKAIVGLSFS